MAVTDARLPRFSRRFVIVLVALLLFAGSLILYAPAAGFGFVGYDDVAVLLRHPNLYAQPSFAAALHEIFVGYFPREEPLLFRDVSWAIDARLFGFENPVGYHLGNLVLNAADVVLLFLLLLHATRRLGFASLTAALFAVLAVHVEPACWIMGRKDLLSACFVLLALLAQSVELRHESRKVRFALAVAVFLLYPLAALSKISAIVLVAVLAAQRILAPYLDGRRTPSQPFVLREWPRALAGLLPHALLGAALYVWYQRTLSAFDVLGGHSPPSLSFAHLKTLAALVPQSLAASLVRIFYAAEHSIFYLRPNVGIAPTAMEVVGAAATVVGLLAGIAASLRWRKDLAFFPLAFLIFLVPYFNFEYVGIWGADRYSYLASFAVVALLAAPIASGLGRHEGWPRRLALAGLLLVVLGGAYQVAAGRRHQLAFRDRESLWTYEKALPRPSVLAQESYASTWFLKAEAAEAGSPSRRHALEAAVAAAQEGIRFYQSIPWRPRPGYASRERTEVASLFLLLGAASELAGGPLEQQLELFRAAYGMYAGDHERVMLARVLLSMALQPPRDPQRARESFDHFRGHVRYASRDRVQWPRLRAELRTYAEQFPELGSEVAALETEIR